MIKLKEDFYAVTFVSYRYEVEKEFNITPVMQGRNFYAILWIWVIEMTLIIILIWSVVFADAGFSITTPNVDVYATRFLATLLMHMKLIEDVKQGINLILYVNTHPEEFSSTTIPFLCGLMQCTGGLGAEGLNLFMLATRVSVEMCITFFVAFHVLADIDVIYAEAICDFQSLEAVEHPLVYKRKPKDIKFRDRPLKLKIAHMMWVAMEFLYNSIYYYYVPFAVNFIPYFFPTTVTGDVPH
jgi:hypothetical protein